MEAYTHAIIEFRIEKFQHYLNVLIPQETWFLNIMKRVLRFLKLSV